VFQFKTDEAREYGILPEKLYPKMKSYCNLKCVTSFLLKVTVFWNVAQCSLVEIDDALEVLTASIIRAIAASQKRVVFIFSDVRT
jgi:hypothetical protein